MLKPLRRFPLVLLDGVVLGGIVLAAATASACSCVGPGTVEEALEAAEAVFSARVVSVTDRSGSSECRKLREGRGDDLDWGGYERHCGRDVTLEVRSVWKGEIGEAVTLYTGQGGGDCGFGFEVAEAYLIYARRLSGGDLSTGICTRTRTLERATQDIAGLGDPVSIHGPPDG